MKINVLLPHTHTQKKGSHIAFMKKPKGFFLGQKELRDFPDNQGTMERKK